MPRRRGELLALVALAALLRFWSLDHGLPDNFLADTTVVRAALSLGAGSNPFAGDTLPTQYPYLLPYVLFLLYGGFYLFGRLTGAFSSVGDFEALAFENPEIFFLLARGVVAVCGCALVVLVYLVMRRLTGGIAPLCAGLFTAGSLIVLLLSQQPRPHVITTLLVVATLLATLRAESRDRGGSVAAWLLAGLAGSATPYGLLSVAIPFVSALRRPTLRGRFGSLGRGLGVLLVVIVLGYPPLLKRPGEAFSYDSQRDVVTYYQGLQVRPGLVDGEGFGKLARWLVLYEPVLALFAITGIVLVVRADAEQRRLWLSVAVYPVLFALIYGSYRIIHPRYLVSLVPFLSLPAGLAASAIAERISSRSRFRVAGLGLLSAVVCLPLVQAARLETVLGRTDTRGLAAAWMATGVARDARVGLEPHGVELVASAAAVERMIASQLPVGLRDRRQIEVGLEGWDVDRLWLGSTARGDWRFAPVSPELDYVVTVTYGDAPRDDAFYRSLVDRGRRVASFDPRARGVEIAETVLPREPMNALMEIWRVSRPGPIVEIHEMRR